MAETATRRGTVPPQIVPLAADAAGPGGGRPRPAYEERPSARRAPRRPCAQRHQPPLPAPRPAAARRPRHPRAACAPGRGATGELATRFALRLVEVLTGARPAGQLSRHTTHDGYRQLARLVQGGPLRPRGGGGRPQLGPVHDFSPAPGALEVCVRVEFGPRHHMVAFRLERHRHTEQWQCAAVEAR